MVKLHRNVTRVYEKVLRPRASDFNEVMSITFSEGSSQTIASMNKRAPWLSHRVCDTQKCLRKAHLEDVKFIRSINMYKFSPSRGRWRKTMGDRSRLLEVQGSDKRFLVLHVQPEPSSGGEGQNSPDQTRQSGMRAVSWEDGERSSDASIYKKRFTRDGWRLDKHFELSHQ